ATDAFTEFTRHAEEPRGATERRERGRHTGRKEGRRGTNSIGERRRKRENGLPTHREKEKGSVRREKRDHNRTSTTEGTQRTPFSFLMPLDNDDDGFSEVSVSAASIAFSGTHPLQAPGSPTTAPGPWLVPSPHKLSQVLEGKRLSQNKGGL
ncbi:hypothetical protein M9458_017682, partial [Cirrhinus mrigala]